MFLGSQVTMESPLSGPAKRTRGLSNGTQVPCCLVDGCRADLSKCRDYHRRHKVCEAHSKTPRVTISGHEQRFCQQCSRFHSLEEFDDEKRSCRKRLDGHNRRRRKPQPDAFISINPARFLSTYQGTRFSPFHNSQTYPSSVGISSPLSVSTNGEAAFQSHLSMITIPAPRKSGYHFPRGSNPTAQIHHSSHHHNHHQYSSPEKEMMSFFQGPPNRSAPTTTTTVPSFLWLHRDDDNDNDNNNNSNNNCALSLLSTTPTGSSSSNSGAHTGNPHSHHHHLVQGGGPDYYYHDHHRGGGLGNVGEQPLVSGSGSGLVIDAGGRENAANNYFHCQDMFRAGPDRSVTGPHFHGSSQYGGGSRIPP